MGPRGGAGMFCLACGLRRASAQAGKDYLRQCFETLQPHEAHPVWYGWQGCVALLGLSELEPLVARAFRSGFVDKDALNIEYFQADLRVFRAASDRREVFEERGLKPIDDALDALAVFEEEEELEPIKPAENPNCSIGFATIRARAGVEKNTRSAVLRQSKADLL